MEENNQNNQNNENNSNINTEEIKQQTVSTVNEVRDTLKNVNVKNDTKEATGLIKELFKNPIDKLAEISKGENNNHFKLLLIIAIVWVAVELISTSFAVSSYFWGSNFLNKTLTVLKSGVAPILTLVALSVIIMVLNKGQKKSFTTVFSVVTTAKIPVVIGEIIGLLTIISSNASTVTSPIKGFCTVISIVLLYFGTKSLYNEQEDKTFVKQFALIMGIFYIVKFAISFLGIAI